MNDDRKHLTQREVEKLIDTAPYGIPVALSRGREPPVAWPVRDILQYFNCSKLLNN
jgi:hypothetical protein